MLTTKDIGDGLELHVCNSLNNGTSRAFMWGQIPGSYLMLAGLFSDIEILRKNRYEFKNDPEKAENLTIDECKNLFRDIGVDILQIVDGVCIYVQCKCYGENNTISVDKLATFGMRLGCNPFERGAVYYTGKISKDAMQIFESYKKIKVDFVNLTNEYKTILPQPATPLLTNEVQPVPVAQPQPVQQPIVQYVLRDYQQKAVVDAEEYYKTNNRGILSFICGGGKTLSSYKISEKYKYVIIVSPYRAHAEQNKQRFEEYSNYNPIIKHILISSDKNGTRNPDEIKEIIATNERVVLSSTFDSVDVVNEIIPSLTNYIVIIDEFHNLSANDLGIADDNEEHDAKNKQNDMNKLLTTAKKILFVSATPKVYSVEGTDDAEFNRKMFGGTISTMTIKEAIQRKCIMDYQIYIPSINEDNTSLYESIKADIDVNVVANEIMAKSIFLMKGLCYNGTRKPIIYCRSVGEIPLFKTAFAKLNEYYAWDIKQYEITANTVNRLEIMNEFANDTCISLMFSVRVLDEGIDIPACDGVYLTYASNSPVRTLQRMFRCVRTNPNNPSKRASIYIYCNEYDDILEMLGSLKEYDESFIEKIHVMNLKLGTPEICESDKVKENQKHVIEKYTVGVVAFKPRTFDESLKLIMEFMNEHKRIPIPSGGIAGEKRLSRWNKWQRKRAKTNTMTPSEREKWNKLATQFDACLENTRFSYFMMMLEKTQQFVTEFGRMPTGKYDKNGNDIITLSSWSNRVLRQYHERTQTLNIDKYRNEYEKFYIQNAKCFEDSWIETLKQFDEHFTNGGERPKPNDELLDIDWLDNQCSYYRRNKMTNAKHKQIFNIFYEKHKMKCLSNEEKWFVYLNEVDKYMQSSLYNIRLQYFDDNGNFTHEIPAIAGQRPSNSSHDKHTKFLGKWLHAQEDRYVKNKSPINTYEYRKPLYDMCKKYSECYDIRKEPVKFFAKIMKLPEPVDDSQ